ncbi:sulfite exporter TauE/SafE family protein [Acuticoccus sp. I52.16.1]|uniref:sulfite exporter TauE/SafE family protein n=1 Tax=Acuticoccus sp. I52.16.1 TaxID=2928472 RepID=UPI001FD48E8F|nr:sulfite exporter TauE/SafE family protein [Acuticoccus sp. I52.16.1]UOM36352.1 sulfite exporter TauE/SafE family protein [Acuticoccus sp. I52.16.1]
MLSQFDFPTSIWLAVLGVTLLAGFVKGAVGFAMPMVMVSGLGSFLAPELALAALILPTLIANLAQAFRDGVAAALDAARTHWRYVAIVSVFIMLSAQMVNLLPAQVLYLAIGVPVTIFALIQLTGRRIAFHSRHQGAVSFALGTVAGLIGGVSGVWGPPTVIYLTSMDTPKVEQLRVQGIVYGIGAVVLTTAHIGSGVLNAQTAPFSALLVVPALVGMLVGRRVSDKMDQSRFRQATLAVLVIAGLNLVRRGLGG